MTTPQISTSPNGEEFTLPVEADCQAENDRLFSERNGIDLPKIVEAIKVRPTHSNMIFHGPGIGGYCLPKDTYPAPGHSWSRFFRNQESLSNLRISKDLKASLTGVDAVILADRHDAYKELEPEQIIAMIGNPAVIIDCFAMLSDTQIKTFFAAGYEVKGLGARPYETIERRGCGKIGLQ